MFARYAALILGSMLIAPSPCPPVRYADGAGQANSTAGLSLSTLTFCYLAVQTRPA
jgi:hypothetical protein